MFIVDSSGNTELTSNEKAQNLEQQKKLDTEEVNVKDHNKHARMNVEDVQEKLGSGEVGIKIKNYPKDKNLENNKNIHNSNTKSENTSIFIVDSSGNVKVVQNERRKTSKKQPSQSTKSRVRSRLFKNEKKITNKTPIFKKLKEIHPFTYFLFVVLICGIADIFSSNTTTRKPPDNISTSENKNKDDDNNNSSVNYQNNYVVFAANNEHDTKETNSYSFRDEYEYKYGTEKEDSYNKNSPQYTRDFNPLNVRTILFGGVYIYRCNALDIIVVSSEYDIPLDERSNAEIIKSKNVDIFFGNIKNVSNMNIEMLAEDGSVINIKTTYKENFVNKESPDLSPKQAKCDRIKNRGPPIFKRVYCVVDNINTIKCPNQYGSSKLGINIIDTKKLKQEGLSNSEIFEFIELLKKYPNIETFGRDSSGNIVYKLGEKYKFGLGKRNYWSNKTFYELLPNGIL